MNPENAAMLKVTAAVVFWGASFTAIKVAVGEVSPVTLLWARFGIGAAMLLPILSARGRLKLVPAADLLDFCILGFIGIFFHNYIQSLGLETASAGTTGIIISATPIAMALMGRVFLSESISLKQWGGIIMSALGVLVVVSGGRFSGFVRIGAISPGELLVTSGIFTWALFSVMSRKKLQGALPDLAMLYTMTFGWLFTSIPFVSGRYWNQLAVLSWKGWISVGFLGIFCSALAYVFWYDGLKSLSSSRVGIFMYISPLVSVAVAAIFLSEPVTPATIGGGVMVLLGVGIVNADWKDRNSEPGAEKD